MSKKNFIDESYKTLKDFTDNLELSEEDYKDIDKFVKELNNTIKVISEKNKNLIVNFGKSFKYLIDEGVKDDNKRNS